MIIKWFKKKIINWVREDWNKVRNEGFEEPSSIVASNSIGGKRRSLDNNGMNFTLHAANGGYVMEYKTYDPKIDRQYTALHIIPSDQELGQGIAHIITLEMLKQ